MAIDPTVIPSTSAVDGVTIELNEAGALETTDRIMRRIGRIEAAGSESSLEITGFTIPENGIFEIVFYAQSLVSKVPVTLELNTVTTGYSTELAQIVTSATYANSATTALLVSSAQSDNDISIRVKGVAGSGTHTNYGGANGYANSLDDANANRRGGYTVVGGRIATTGAITQVAVNLAAGTFTAGDYVEVYSYA